MNGCIKNPYHISPKLTDFAQTDPWAVKMLLDRETFDGDIWEPCCGKGNISRVLSDRGYKVESTDLYYFGFGKSGVDFTKIIHLVDNVVCCPPFTEAEAFMHAAILQTRNMIAMLLPVELTQGAGRYYRIYKDMPPTHLYIFADKLHSMRLAWWIWDMRMAEREYTETRWIEHTPSRERK